MADLDSINVEPFLKRYDIVMESKESPQDIASRMYPAEPALRKVAEDIVFLKNKNIEADVQAALSEFSPNEVIDGGLLRGIEIVSEIYDRGIYYLPHVMVAADGFDKGIKVAEKALAGERQVKGTVVMHAAEGDPHDIGKNIAAVLLKSNGYGVIDLGRDVAVDDVVKTVLDKRPDVLTGTALMTTTMSAFPRVAEKLKENGMELPFICAGGAVNRGYVESFPMGIYADKAAEGPRLVAKSMEGWDWRKIRENWDKLIRGEKGEE
ncbi:MAG TPA: cobalamin-dependent protein [Methanomassiliicoccaceae archaeon]|nr:cobalamin-dependent protein [Methanomassiliicoccaceae archaeon]